MGNRVKGRPKRKGIKSALSSSMGSKRKLSRMGKKQKKGHSGLEATFIGRAACLRKLQISLKDFRRLCILKGVYPREPRGKTPGNKKGQIYYHIKDVKAIAHEPLLEKFREFKSFMKRIRKAAGRNEKDEARRLDAQNPVYTLNHLVRERYPSFIDALSDLDDALALIHLFAALPSANRIKTNVTNKAKELCAAWATYCAITSSITKTFVSVKGVYFEANVLSAGNSRNSSEPVPIRWVVPHAFTQYLPKDVDYRVMLTFFEFYEVLLGFVLFKLYNDIGIRYPFSAIYLKGKEHGASTLFSYHLYTLSRVLREKEGAISTTVSAAVEKYVPNNMDNAESSKQSNKKTKLNEKVDEALQKISNNNPNGIENDHDMYNSEEDESNNDVSSALKAALENLAEEQSRRITPSGEKNQLILNHDASQRKHLFSKLTFFLSREIPRGYIELVCLSYGGRVGWDGDDSPISIKDQSITHHIVDRPKLFSSVNSYINSREFVQPQWILDSANNEFLLPCSKYCVGCELPPHLSPWVDNEEEGYKPAYAEEIEKLKRGETLDDNRDYNDKAEVLNTLSPQRNIESEEEKEEEDDDDMEEAIKNTKRAKEEEEAHNLAKLLMSKKSARLYGRMQHGISEKQEKINILKQRRETIDLEKFSRKRDEIDISVKGKSLNGKSPSKQKVERLKDERKTIEKIYDENGSKKKKNKKRKVNMSSNKK